jgi:hypothetical protein
MGIIVEIVVSRRENTMHRSRVEGSSPLATVEDIQRRLLRPPTLLSTPPTSSLSYPYTHSLSVTSNSTEIFWNLISSCLIRLCMAEMAFQAAIHLDIR